MVRASREQDVTDIDHRQLRGIAAPRLDRRPVVKVIVLGLMIAALAVLAQGDVLRIVLTAVSAAIVGAGMAELARPGLLDIGAHRRARAEERLRTAVMALIDHDGDPAFLTDADAGILYRNAAAEDRFGAAEAHLSEVLSLVFANPEALLYRLQLRADADGTAREDIVTRGGQYRLSVVQVGEAAHLWRLESIGAATGQPPRAADTLSLPMLTAGGSGAILYVNEAFRTLLGHRPKSLQAVIGTSDPRTGQVVEIETPSGPRRILLGVLDGIAGRREIFALPHHEGEVDPPSRVVLAGPDAIDALPVPVLTLSGDGTIQSSNVEARDLLGVETTGGRRLQDLLDGTGRPVDDWLADAARGGSRKSTQFLFGKADSAETFVQVTLGAAQGPDGERLLLAVLNDVTELKTLEVQFVQGQKMHAIGQLAGGVAHDFNNLLTAISGHCDLLLLRHDQSDQDYGDLIQIHQNANRAASLVGQLLAYSRKQNLQPEKVDLRDTLADLTHLLNRLVGEKVRLTLDHDPELDSIRADRRQLEQVMMNLVVNARDAMPEGGDIRIRTENVRLAQEERRGNAAIPPGDYVLVRVADEGVGIPPDVLPKIFEPFYTTKRTGEGTGLGLSTAYGIVKQTGGFIFANSVPGEGTEFQLYFPRYDAPPAQAPQAEPRKQASRPRTGEGVILLVEDEAPVRAFAQRALRMRGYHVIEAENGERALEMLTDDDLRVDVFLTDVIMPGMDGPTWVRQALVSRPGTKVIFVSGYAEDAFDDREDKVPQAVFLPKPFSLEALIKTVDQVLE